MYELGSDPFVLVVVGPDRFGFGCFVVYECCLWFSFASMILEEFCYSVLGVLWFGFASLFGFVWFSELLCDSGNGFWLCIFFGIVMCDSGNGFC